ncbi:MAG: hypothetical protein KJO79_04755 [Verrucomicrobiae bacterium]|nr:hypothetical protein [Verrucomicrobiae bacterium]NNJ86467.1 hypothetical protein [Akkermansiaceae bacterium]
MKIQHIVILTVVAAALASCAPVPPPNPNGMGGAGTPGVSTPTPQFTGPEVPAPMVESNRKVPTGHPDPQGRPNMVVSPYRPYNVIDVKGYRSGEIVGDPSTAKVNPSTGKLDLSTAKHFRIP